jgi:hypothetical protein
MCRKPRIYTVQGVLCAPPPPVQREEAERKLRPDEGPPHRVVAGHVVDLPDLCCKPPVSAYSYSNAVSCNLCSYLFALVAIVVAIQRYS